MPTLTPTDYGYRVTHTSHEDTKHGHIVITSRRTNTAADCDSSRQYTDKRRTIDRHQQRNLKRSATA